MIAAVSHAALPVRLKLLHVLHAERDTAVSTKCHCPLLLTSACADIAVHSFPLSKCRRRGPAAARKCLIRIDAQFGPTGPSCPLGRRGSMERLGAGYASLCESGRGGARPPSRLMRSSKYYSGNVHHHFPRLHGHCIQNKGKKPRKRLERIWPPKASAQCWADLIDTRRLGPRRTNTDGRIS